jgi:hypothetical protein
MSNKIDKLTPEQEVRLNECYENALVVGRSCEPIDHDKATSVINKFYAAVDSAAPRILFFDSPVSCIKAASLYKDVEDWKNLDVDYAAVSKHVPDRDTVNMMLSNKFAGQQWISWSTFYDFGREIGAKYDAESSKLLDMWIEEGKAMHWWFPFDGVVFVSERPKFLHVNEAGDMHCDGGPAFEYKDGWKGFYLNGVEVTEYLATTPAEDLKVDYFLKESNADVKAEFARKYGVERMLDMGKKVDSYTNYNQEENTWWWKSEYELWDMHVLFPGIEYQPYLKMLNQTTGIWHVEAVSPDCRTIADAVKERFGGREMEIVSIS